MLVATAGEAMQVPRRRWTLLFWPIYLFVFIAVWFPNLSFTAEWPVLASEVPLAILIIQGLRRSSARDRMIAAAFLFYWFVRLTLSTPSSSSRHEAIRLDRRLALAVHNHHPDPAGNRDACHPGSRPYPRPP
jgi:hypothetical protein